MRTLLMSLFLFTSMTVLLGCSTTPKQMAPVTPEAITSPEHNPDDTPIVQLATKDQTAAVIDLVKKGTSPDTANHNGVTALMIASYRGNVELIKQLKENNASINFQDKQGSSALHYAVIRDQLASVKILSKLKANLEITDQFNLSPLMLAVRFASPGVIEHLIERGAPINQRESEGWSAIFFSIPRGRKDIFELLVSKGADLHTPDVHGLTLLMIATEYGQLPLIQRLFELKLNPLAVDLNGENILHKAVQTTRIDVLRLIGQLAPTLINTSNLEKVTPLIMAVKTKNKTLVDELLQLGADLTLTDAQGKSAIDWAQELNLELELPNSQNGP